MFSKPPRSAWTLGQHFRLSALMTFCAVSFWASCFYLGGAA